MRWVAARRAALVGGLAAVAAVIATVLRRILATVPSRPSPERAAPGPSVTPAEREAAWAARAAQSMLEQRISDLAEASAEVDRLRDRLASLEQHAASVDEQLRSARRHLADHTAVANENLRLRGAVDALTEAIAAVHRSVGEDRADLEQDVEEARAELVSLELQIKELAEERDRAVDEADALRDALDAASRDRGPDSERRLRLELEHVRRSLAVERQRNLRLGRRHRDDRD
jgi:chromosome segregation ATPase